MNKSIFFGFLAGLLSAFLSSAWAQVAEEVITLPSRDGVRIAYLLTQMSGVAPKSVFVLLSGGDGGHRLSQRGSVVHLFNDARFPARSRVLFATNDAVAALVDAPSDRDGLSDRFRASAAHLHDLSVVLADLRQRYPGVPVTVVGHSNGTLSAASLATTLQVGDRVVLMGGRLVAHWFGGEGLARFDFGQIRVPLLLVHHRHDDCTVTPYSGALALAERYPLITVDGPMGGERGACTSEGMHGLSGRDRPVVEAVRAWVQGQAWPREIGD